ncbi:hypothetical protein Hanom_Chr10g00884231 [Helianthus anomalus]
MRKTSMEFVRGPYALLEHLHQTACIVYRLSSLSLSLSLSIYIYIYIKSIDKITHLIYKSEIGCSNALLTYNI